ncbi:MAG: hypothetical protein V3W18_06745 [candidate division Zixibacteria bacterium]
MPFTTRDIVKKHILDHHIGSITAENESVVLASTDYVSLGRRMILKDTEKVKGKEQIEPSRADISFSGSDSFNLSHTELMPDTVVVAADSSLGTIYVENIDYHVDYNTGQISRIVSGAIPSGGNATAWYMHYRLYQRGVDYDFDSQGGKLRRKSSGAIESGQRLFVDYTAEFGGLDDEAMDNAITEANDQIISFIDDTHRDSTDRSLVTAETYLSVSIICRIRAMESISPSRNLSNNAQEARSWSSLSDIYKKEAYSLLSNYSGLIGSLKPPSKA